MNKYYEKITQYFNSKAFVYDDVDDQFYWVLSDQFYKSILQKQISRYFKNKKKIKLLDAGAGTGRWTLNFYNLFKKRFKMSGILIDISKNMLEIAEKKFKQLSIENDFEFINGNIENMNDIKDSSMDIAISFYNVLSFVEKPKKAIEEVWKKLKKGGAYVSIVGSKYHSLYFSILTGRFNELDIIDKKSKVRFNDLMPYMHCFTPDEIKKIFKLVGFKKVLVIGGPNFIYPGMEETFTHGNTNSIKYKLNRKNIYKKIIEIELKYCDNLDVVGRGNVLMVIAEK